MWLVFVDGPANCTPAYLSARQNNLKVMTIWFDRIAHSDGDKHILCKNKDPKNIISQVKELIPSEAILGFIGFTDSMIPIAGLLNSTLEIPGPYSYEKALMSKNKLSMRELLKDDPFNPKFFPLYYENESLNDLEKFRKYDFNVPWIIKPIFGHASIGVRKISSFDELKNTMPELHDANSKMLESIYGLDENYIRNVKSTFLLESYFEGAEFSVELLILNEKIFPLEVCSKSEMKEPYFEEVTYVAPAEISTELREILFGHATQIVKKMGINNTCAHVEFRWNGQQSCFLDIGLRAGGGGLTHKLIEISSGRQLFSAWFKALKNTSHEISLKSSSKNTALLYLAQIGSGGTILRFNLDKIPAELLALMEEYQLFNQPGDQLTGYPNYSGLPGYVLYRIDQKTSKDEKFKIQNLIFESAKYFDPQYEV